MKHSKILSLIIAFALTVNFSFFPLNKDNNSGISTCEENPCDFIFNDH